MEGAPDPSVGHDGSAGDARCLLDHLPDPCDYVDKKGKKCTEYGDDDPDYLPPLSVKQKAVKEAERVVKETEKVDSRDQAVPDLSAKNDQMEANLSHMQGSVGKLTDDMATLMKMVATLTKRDPHPSASLSDTGLPRGAPTGHPQASLTLTKYARGAPISPRS